MFKTLINIFRVPELRNKVLFTLFMLAIYRIGYHVPLPGVDQDAFVPKERRELMDAERAVKTTEQLLAGRQDEAANDERQKAHDALDAAKRRYNESVAGGENTAATRLANYVSLFSGGNLSQSTIFGLGVMPYISASIIFQLLGTVVPSLEKMQKEGETGRKKIQEWTRYATVPLALIQGVFWLSYMHKGTGTPLVQSVFMGQHSVAFWVTGLCALTAGCVFLMWLGEQIDEYGLGNGVSLIILAGIVARMPAAIVQLYELADFGQNAQPYSMTPGKILFLVASFIFVVSGSILITQAQRRIPIQQAKQTRGRRVYGGSKQYLPLRVNHGGVMPIIFAQSLMLFPGVFFGWLNSVMHSQNRDPGFFTRLVEFLNVEFGRGAFIYVITEVAMIYFFAYFWTTVQFQPKEMANQLRDYGSFIPGLRPGRRTADYLEKVMFRITYVGAAFLCLIAIVPTVISASMSIPIQITAFLGGTGLLIVVSVALDMVQRIEANLLMRNYGGFLGGDGRKGKRIKGRQY